MVGVNVHQAGQEEPQEVLKINPQAEREQTARVRALRERRDGPRADAALEALATSAAEGSNLMPRILDCVRAEVTLGEIADRLRGVFGEWRAEGI